MIWQQISLLQIDVFRVPSLPLLFFLNGYLPLSTLSLFGPSHLDGICVPRKDHDYPLVSFRSPLPVAPIIMPCAQALDLKIDELSLPITPSIRSSLLLIQTTLIGGSKTLIDSPPRF